MIGSITLRLEKRNEPSLRFGPRHDVDIKRSPADPTGCNSQCANDGELLTRTAEIPVEEIKNSSEVHWHVNVTWEWVGVPFLVTGSTRAITHGSPTVPASERRGFRASSPLGRRDAGPTTDLSPLYCWRLAGTEAANQ